jgi:hypothetical protein
MKKVRQTVNELRLAPPARSPTLRRILLRVAWLSILLGLGMQVLLLLITVGAGTNPGTQTLIPDLVQKISWSFVVCMGLTLGTAAAQVHASLRGLAGLLSAPVAFILSHSLNHAAAQALELTERASSAPSLFPLAPLRGIEYLCLGLALLWVGQHPWRGPTAYALVGCGTGVFFGSLVLALTSQAALTTVTLLAWGVNEVLFPVGCSLIIFTAETLGKRAG